MLDSVTLLSGVVRNRKMAGAVSRASALFNEGSDSPHAPQTYYEKVWGYLGKNAICRKFKLRVHKFKFQWDLVLHLSICLSSLLPFTVTGNRQYTWMPIVVWAFYNSLILMGPRYANSVIPGFSKLQHNFKVTMEEFFAPVLLPLLSGSFLLVALSLVVTGHRLGGPPLCFQPCGQCLAQWSNGILMADLSEEQLRDYDPYRKGCGYANGKELLGYYTMAQTSFLLFLTVVVAMSVCLGWKIADEELREFRDGEEWLKKQDQRAFDLRDEILKRFGSPSSPIRPEGSLAWVVFGINAALSFALLGWHNWYVLPPSNTATLLIILNLATMITTLFILHYGFFGRLLALYKRNFLRVEHLTVLLASLTEKDMDYWWNCRNFVLNDDLSLDYDIGGLAVSVTFLITCMLFVIFVRQVITEKFRKAVTESPGGYCAYAVMYLTSCLIKLFTLATKTYEEQHRHVEVLQKLSYTLQYRAGGGAAAAAGGGGGVGGVNGEGTPMPNSSHAALSSELSAWQVQDEELEQLRDDGPIDIDSESNDDEKAALINNKPRRFSNVFSPRANRGGGGSNQNFLETMASNLKLTRSLFALPSDNIPSPLPNPNPNMFASRSMSNANLVNSSDEGSGGRLLPSVSMDKGGMPGLSMGGNRLSLDLPSIPDIENPEVGSPSLYTGAAPTSSVPPMPTLLRAESTGAANDSYTKTIAEIMSEIRRYDPYPCILGIPIMPSIFNHSKRYIFLVFMLLGSRTFMICMEEIWASGSAQE